MTSPDHPPSLIQVEIPFHLASLAGSGRLLRVELFEPVTIDAVLTAIERRYPMLRGTIRDQGTLTRRPFLRFFCCEQDLSHQPTAQPLPAAVAEGREPLIILGSISGGLGPVSGRRR